jgi:hypothetical protein
MPGQTRVAIPRDFLEPGPWPRHSARANLENSRTSGPWHEFDVMPTLMCSVQLMARPLTRGLTLTLEGLAQNRSIMVDAG